MEDLTPIAVQISVVLLGSSSELGMAKLLPSLQHHRQCTSGLPHHQNLKVSAEHHKQ